MRDFHPDTRFAYHTISTEDYRLAENCPDRATLDARCRDRAATIAARADLPGSILLLHESPFGVNESLNPMVAEVLLPHILDALKARGLRCGPIAPSAPKGGLSRFLFLAPLLYR
ncbi:MAG: hypothetical protein JOZ42_06530, partial [Acetobacteraceae bacterium]|nr:hypothetical protein [Acetobacteraceae bacterium]